MSQSLDIAILIPCHNEGDVIATVVQDFKKIIPHATVYVYDNCSTDNTIEQAYQAGAIVRSEPHLGKGNVVKRMFADIEADLYLLTDGDATYDAKNAPLMIKTLLDNHLDMVVGKRIESQKTAYRLGHRFGNRFFNW